MLFYVHSTAFLHKKIRLLDLEKVDFLTALWKIAVDTCLNSLLMITEGKNLSGFARIGLISLFSIFFQNVPSIHLTAPSIHLTALSLYGSIHSTAGFCLGSLHSLGVQILMTSQYRDQQRQSDWLIPFVFFHSKYRLLYNFNVRNSQ